jgi:hypothetical protein
VSIETGVPQDQLIVIAQLSALMYHFSESQYEKTLGNVLVDTIDIFAEKEKAPHSRYLRAVELLVGEIKAWVSAVREEILSRPQEGEGRPQVRVRWVSLDPGTGGPDEERGETDKDA